MKILVVDDSKTTRKYVSRCLRMAGFTDLVIDEAENGLDALKHLAENKPDLVVTDWNMPHMSGIDFLSQVRSTGNEVKVGFITSEGTDKVRKEAQSGGAQFFITKPFTPETLKAELQRILS